MPVAPFSPLTHVSADAPVCGPANPGFVDVTPRKGRALFFRRGSADAVLHAGLPVSGEVPKYMALINLAYGERT